MTPDQTIDALLWLCGTLAAQLWRMRRRALTAEGKVVRWQKACAALEQSNADLADEVEAERARTDALHTELVALNRALNT